MSEKAKLQDCSRFPHKCNIDSCRLRFFQVVSKPTSNGSGSLGAQFQAIINHISHTNSSNDKTGTVTGNIATEMSDSSGGSIQNLFSKLNEFITGLMSSVSHYFNGVEEDDGINTVHVKMNATGRQPTSKKTATGQTKNASGTKSTSRYVRTLYR